MTRTSRVLAAMAASEGHATRVPRTATRRLREAATGTVADDWHATQADREDPSSCPWYRGVGICDQGCRSEPYCQTGRPDGGWPSERRPNRPWDIVRRARHHGRPQGITRRARRHGQALR